jgi:hypothetical protein
MRSILPLSLLCLLLPASTVSAQVAVEPIVLAGVFVTDRDNLFPASPAFNVGLDVRVSVPADGYQIAVAPFFGVDGTLVLIEESHEVMATARGGFRLDSPGYPRVFGFVGQAWPAPPAPDEEGVDDDVASPVVVSQTVYGGGVSLQFRRLTLEGRYAFDRRWEVGRRTSFAILVGSTF